MEEIFYKDIRNIINDYKYSMEIYLIKQKLNKEFFETFSFKNVEDNHFLQIYLGDNIPRSYIKNIKNNTISSYSLFSEYYNDGHFRFNYDFLKIITIYNETVINTKTL